MAFEGLSEKLHGVFSGLKGKGSLTEQDTIWFGADGGYAFLNTLAEDRKLQMKSLKRLEEILRKRKLKLKIVTGHTGWTDDIDFAFAHTDEICNSLRRKPKVHDPKAPYDGFDERDDTEANARNGFLDKC